MNTGADLSPRGIARIVLSFLEAHDLRSQAARLRAAGAAVRAPDDPFFRLDLAKRLLATFPDATLVEFPGARAFVSLDEPERLAGEIIRWLA